ncbi:MAG TPA: molybdate ABC transporter substrate-binding protein [Acidimicrobiales bacterium]|nr:molybdate ABC transporter substrate-binding protein [Acidimicrobiales bacterium]
MTTGRQATAAVLSVLLLLAGCGGDDGGDGTLRVAAAASLTDVVDGLSAVLEDDDDPLRVEVDLGGSSTLARQIVEGAPADLFLSADAATVEQVVDAGLAAGEVLPFASNHLVLVVPAGNPGGVRSLDDLARDELLVGRCAPEVPCGRLALAELDESGIDDAADTEEPDVRSLLVKVAEGELDAALVYATDVAAAGDDVEVVVDERLDRRTEYQAVRIDGGDIEAAERFLRLLRGPAGESLLAALGFEAP